MQKPKISIVTINYNNRSGFEKTVQSVQNQEALKLFEHVVIDAGSTDGSVEIIQKYKDGISYWISEPDKGIYDGQNKGIRNSKGDYILFLNSGDVLASPNTIMEICSFPLGADLIYGNMFIESVDGNIFLGLQPSKITLRYLLQDTIWHPACLIRRDLFARFGLYDTNFKIVADYEFWLRIFSSNQISTKYIPIPFSTFNLKGLSSDPKNRIFINRERNISQSMYYDRFDLFFFRDIPLVMKSFYLAIRSILKKLIMLR